MGRLSVWGPHFEWHGLLHCGSLVPPILSRHGKAYTFILAASAPSAEVKQIIRMGTVIFQP